MDNIPTWVAVAIASTISVIVAILVQIFVVPWQRKKILGQTKNSQPVKFTFGDSDGKLDDSNCLSVVLNDLFFYF